MSDLESRCFRKVRNPRTGAVGLIAADVMAEELLASLPDGKDVLVTVRRARNPKHHKLLWALLRKVVENSDRWADEHVLLDDLKLATGLFETRVSALTGMPYPVPASISFAAMDQTRFAVWWQKAIAVLARDVLNVAPDDLRREVEEMLSPRERRAA